MLRLRLLRFRVLRLRTFLFPPTLAVYRFIISTGWRVIGDIGFSAFSIPIALFLEYGLGSLWKKYTFVHFLFYLM